MKLIMLYSLKMQIVEKGILIVKDSSNTEIYLVKSKYSIYVSYAF